MTKLVIVCRRMGPHLVVRVCARTVIYSQATFYIDKSSKILWWWCIGGESTTNNSVKKISSNLTKISEAETKNCFVEEKMPKTTTYLNVIIG